MSGDRVLYSTLETTSVRRVSSLVVVKFENAIKRLVLLVSSVKNNETQDAVIINNVIPFNHYHTAVCHVIIIIITYSHVYT